MSWGAFTDIYVKNKRNWELKEKNKNFDLFKNFCSTREIFDDDLIPTNLSIEDKEKLEKFLEQNKWEHYNFVATLTPERFEQLNAPVHFETWNEYGQQESGFIIDKKDIENDFALSAKEILDLTPEKRSSCYNLYYISKEERGNGRGEFFRIKDFEDYKEKMTARLNKLQGEKFELNSKINSIDYLKLSREEKENIDEEVSERLQCIEEAIIETKFKYEASVSAIAILDYYMGFEDDAVMYIFFE